MLVNDTYSLKIYQCTGLIQKIYGSPDNLISKGKNDDIAFSFLLIKILPFTFYILQKPILTYQFFCQLAIFPYGDFNFKRTDTVGWQLVHQQILQVGN